jgi:hypothetical protein
LDVRYFGPFSASEIISYFGIFPLPNVWLAAMGSAYPEEYRRFLKKIKAARLEAGLTQVEVARRLKKPQSFVSKFETGERRIDPVELRHLAEFYGKSINDFV